MQTIFSTIHTPQGYETIPVNVPTYATPRSIIRRAKSAHGIHAQHRATNGVGPDGSPYIHLRLHGSKATIHIDLDSMGVDE